MRARAVVLILALVAPLNAACASDDGSSVGTRAPSEKTGDAKPLTEADRSGESRRSDRDRSRTSDRSQDDVESDKPPDSTVADEPTGAEADVCADKVDATDTKASASTQVCVPPG